MMFKPITAATPLERGPVPHAGTCVECLPFEVEKVSPHQQQLDLVYLKDRYKPPPALWAMVKIVYKTNGYVAALKCFHDGIERGIGQTAKEGKA